MTNLWAFLPTDPSPLMLLRLSSTPRRVRCPDVSCLVNFFHTNPAFPGGAWVTGQAEMTHHRLRALAATLLTGFIFVLLLPVPSRAQSGSGTTASADAGNPAAITGNVEGRAGDSIMARQATNTAVKPAKPTYFTQLWDLDKSTREEYAIKVHRPTWGLVWSYNTSPNLAPLRAVDPDKTLKKPEVVFQLSVKAKLWQDLFGGPVDLWFGYTQRSFWQVYNTADSSPFRETNYEPEILFNFRTDYNLLGLRGRFVNVGVNHQSNGQIQALSRSWNRVVVNLGFEKEPFSFLLKTWYRFPEPAETDDNPHIERYLGYGELWTYYFHNRHRFALMLRDNFNFHQNRGALQAEWAFPSFFGHLGGYVQYFFGYGENLLDYNHRVNRIGLGFILMDW
jgi:phospholipase A1